MLCAGQVVVLETPDFRFILDKYGKKHPLIEKRKTDCNRLKSISFGIGYKIKDTRKYNKIFNNSKKIEIHTLNDRVVGGEKFTVELVHNLVIHKIDKRMKNKDYLTDIHLIAVPKDVNNRKMSRQEIEN